MSTVLEQLNWRYATKAFDASRKLSSEQLATLKESMRMTPSSFGLQPWHFIFVCKSDVREKVKAASWGQSQVVDCSHHVVLCRKQDLTEADVDAHVNDIAKTRNVPIEGLKAYAQVMKGFLSAKTKEQVAQWMEKQVYIALGQLLTVCAELKIDACPMEGMDAAQYDEILQLPAKGLRAVVTCPIGFRSANDKYAELAKVRFPQGSIVSEI